MKFYNHSIYIDYNEMLLAGFSRRTILSWDTPIKISDPSDKRVKIFNFEKLKLKYKEKLEAYFGDVYQYADNQVLIESVYFKLTQTDKTTIEDYKLNDGRALPTKYIERYKQDCRFLNLASQVDKRIAKSLGYPRLSNFQSALFSLIKSDSVTRLAASRTRFAETLREYKTEGAMCLIKKDAYRFGNTNSTIIEGEIADFILAMYCLPTKKTIVQVHEAYVRKMVSNGYPALTEQAIEYYLKKPAIKPIWTLARHGKDTYKKQYEHHLKLRKPSFSNAMWSIDGTKLDVYYLDDNKRVSKLRIDVVIDVYSEKILGYHVSESETHIDHYKAFKMAVKATQIKPFQLSYDNQSAHKSDLMQRFYDNLIAEGGTHFPTRAYAKGGNPIEQLFGRFQKQVLKEFWFCDGQSPLSKREDSKVNISSIIGEKDKTAHKEKVKKLFPNNTHLLPTKEEVIEKYVPFIINKWNTNNYPKTKTTRDNRYFDCEVKDEQPINFLDMVNLFWITTARPITYYKGGLTLTIGKNEYEYEVYDINNEIDQQFRKRNLNCKFFVQYDPDDLTQVRLCEKNGESLQLIAVATEKREHALAVADQQKGDASRRYTDFKVRDEEFETVLDEIMRLREVTGITPEKEIEKAQNILKEGAYALKQDRNEAEATSAADLL